MKNCLLLLVLVIIQVTIINGATSMGNYSNPDYPGKCYVSADEIYEPGTHKVKNECEEFACGEDGWGSHFSCGVMAVSNKNGDCRQGDYYDVNLPYPACCKLNFHCKDDDGNEYIQVHPQD